MASAPNEEVMVTNEVMVGVNEGNVRPITHDVGITDAERNRASYRSKLFVVVKLMGRSIEYKAICTRIQELWRLMGEFRVVDMDNHFFLIQLSNEEDVMKALLQRPWTIMGDGRLPTATRMPHCPTVLKPVEDLSVPRERNNSSESLVAWPPVKGPAEEDSLFGTWMLAPQKTRRSPKNVGGNQGNTTVTAALKSSGSRFDALNSVVTPFSFDPTVDKSQPKGYHVICKETNSEGASISSNKRNGPSKGKQAEKNIVGQGPMIASTNPALQAASHAPKLAQKNKRHA
ncbi:hypothetical protein Scep_018874 [Stephania cephalantha]|uniref:DUF4283 domain-containing protein n=1 Tax=Stephania cephalantha TaxID=152367 RepID=A0AAP0NMP3_9MAGN